MPKKQRTRSTAVTMATRTRTVQREQEQEKNTHNNNKNRNNKKKSEEQLKSTRRTIATTPWTEWDPEELMDVERMPQKTRSILEGLYNPNGESLGMVLCHICLLICHITRHCWLSLLPRHPISGSWVWQCKDSAPGSKIDLPSGKLT